MRKLGICGICLALLWRIFFFASILIFQGINGQGNRWLSAHATFYGSNQNPTTLGGACGYDNTFHAGFGIHTAAVSGALFRGGEACGGCYQVMCDYKMDPKWCLRHRLVTVTATNFCPQNNNGGWCDPPRHHFDMSTPAFLRIARQGNEGIVPVIYRRVTCKRRGGVRFTLRGKGNFNMVMISNVGGSGDVKCAWIKGSRMRTWMPMHRNWGANWQSSVDLRWQNLSFKLTLVDGKTLAFFNVVPSNWRCLCQFSFLITSALYQDRPVGHGPCSPHHRFSHTEEAKMAGDRNGLMPEKAERYSERRDEEEEKENEGKSRKSRENTGSDSDSDSEEDRRKHGKSRRKTRESSDSDGERRKGKSRRRYSSKEDSSSGSESEYSDSEHSGSDSESESSESEESESERGRRKRKEKKRRREKEEERERKKRKREKERKRRRREREEDRKKKEKRRKKKEKRRKKDRGKTGAVTNSWGKYGIIKETDMWNKRPEFTAWLAEVKQVNLESLPNWEEKQMFKEFMEDHNTATFPSKKYYNLDAYFKHKMEKDMKRGYKKIQVSERTVFNDEEQRRQELLREREKQKEAEVDALKRSMQSGMAQAMKEQAQLREEMVYQYKVGNLEAAAAIQRRLDPDVAM